MRDGKAARPRIVREHGNYYKYQIERCRCDLCRAANAAHAREMRKANPETNRRNLKKRREKWDEAGRCVHCGAEGREEGKKTCVKCREYGRDFYERKKESV